MCRQSIYYNTYGDGAEDVTERIDTCRTGKMCTSPEVRKYTRRFPYTKPRSGQETTSGLADLNLGPYHGDFLTLPPTPRKSPSPSRGSSGVYINGAKVADIPSSPKKRSSHHRRRSSDRVVVVPEPPSPLLPSKRRSSTMPDFVVMDVPPRGRSSRPTTSESSTSSRGRDRDHHRRHYYRHQTDTLDHVLGLEDLGRRTTRPAQRSPSRTDRHRSDGRRSHHHHHHRRHHQRSPSPAPAHHGSWVTTSSSSASEDEQGSDNPAAAAVRKELRWQDEVDRERAAQNERISRRPKPYLHQHHHHLPKGILKKQQQQQRWAQADPYEELVRAVGGMGIHHHHPGTGGVAAPGWDDATAAADAAYWSRLRGRFDETRDGRGRRGVRVRYPGESVYKYM